MDRFSILLIAALLIAVSVNIALLAIAFYLLRRWTAKRVPRAVWRQGARNLMSTKFLICGIGTVAAWLAVSFGISWISDQPLRHSFRTGFGVLWVVIFVVFLGTWLYSKRVAGPTLLDCGPYPLRKLSLFTGTFLVLVGLACGLGWFLVGKPDNQEGIDLPLTITFAITSGAYGLIIGFGRLQIRENGIWQHCGLLKWDRIQSYHWEGETDHTLMVRLKGGLFHFAHLVLPVPSGRKDRVHSLLQQHVSPANEDGFDEFRPELGRRLQPVFVLLAVIAVGWLVLTLSSQFVLRQMTEIIAALLTAVLIWLSLVDWQRGYRTRAVRKAGPLLLSSPRVDAIRQLRKGAAYGCLIVFWTIIFSGKFAAAFVDGHTSWTAIWAFFWLLMVLLSVTAVGQLTGVWNCENTVLSHAKEEWPLCRGIISNTANGHFLAVGSAWSSSLTRPISQRTRFGFPLHK